MIIIIIFTIIINIIIIIIIMTCTIHIDNIPFTESPRGLPYLGWS